MAVEDELRRALSHAVGSGAAARTLSFQRIAKLLIEAQGTSDPDLKIQALAALERLRPEVTAAGRREVLRLAAARWPDRAMLWLFRHENAAELAELAAKARLSAADWRTLLAELPDETRHSIADTPIVARTASGHPSIEDAVEQVEQLAGRLGPAAAAPAGVAALAGDWRWECDARGVLSFVDGPAPVEVGELLFGLECSDRLWAAFARRCPFRDVESTVGARAVMLAGVPFFERGSGRFLGYRGTAQTVEPAGLFGTGASGDSLAKVAHEVRSPLNAIMGFAQMIESETLGAAPEVYRRRAGAILDNAQRLLGVLDDLTDAARLDGGHWTVDPEAVDTVALVERLADRYRPIAAVRGVSIAVTVPPGLPPAHTDERSLDRAVKRLLAAVIAVAETGETLLVGVQRHGRDLRLFVTRPSALDELGADRLLDAVSLAGEGANAPLLGLGFGLRLVRQLAEAMNGTFAIEPHRFTLTVPTGETGEQAVANEDQSA